MNNFAQASSASVAGPLRTDLLRTAFTIGVGSHARCSHWLEGTWFPSLQRVDRSYRVLV